MLFLSLDQEYSNIFLRMHVYEEKMQKCKVLEKRQTGYYLDVCALSGNAVNYKFRMYQNFDISVEILRNKRSFGLWEFLKYNDIHVNRAYEIFMEMI